jgi:hypothetical protein
MLLEQLITMWEVLNHLAFQVNKMHKSQIVNIQILVGRYLYGFYSTLRGRDPIPGGSWSDYNEALYVLHYLE